MNIGIFLNYDPYVKLYKEGLGRYLSSQIEGYLKSGNKVTIICPKWLEDSLSFLEKDTGIDMGGAKVVTTPNIPLAWRVYSALKRKRKVKRDKSLVIKKLIGKLLNRFVSVSGFTDCIIFLVETLVLFFVGIVAVLPVLMGYLLYKLFGILKKIFKRFKAQILQFIEFDSLFQTMLDNSAKELVEIANRQKGIDVWFVPGLFWPQVNLIKGLVVINVPDIETEVFSEGFASKSASSATSRLRDTLENGKYFITYSEYIKHALIEEQQAGQGKYAVTILQDNHDLSKELGFDKNITNLINRSYSDALRQFAEFNVNCLGKIRYTKFSTVKYIFFASQYRANKNIGTLLRAYDYMVHECFRKEKLVLTCDAFAVPELRDYIVSRNLIDDVVVCANVSTQKLASLYCCAELVVNPTLYEGGFPFTFGEGMSVGTPSIMGNIPQTIDVIKNYGLEEILFDPYNYKDMAQKIIWGLDNVDSIYEKELPLYADLKRRTPEYVALEYVEAFRRYK